MREKERGKGEGGRGGGKEGRQLTTRDDEHRKECGGVACRLRQHGEVGKEAAIELAHGRNRREWGREGYDWKPERAGGSDEPCAAAVHHESLRFVLPQTLSGLTFLPFNQSSALPPSCRLMTSLASSRASVSTAPYLIVPLAQKRRHCVCRIKRSTCFTIKRLPYHSSGTPLRMGEGEGRGRSGRERRKDGWLRKQRGRNGNNGSIAVAMSQSHCSHHHRGLAGR